MPCSLCDKSIDESSGSREHIIPNALGGRRVVRGFLCKDCNNETGQKWDGTLEAQLRLMALLFGVKRQDREETRAYVVEALSGAKYLLNADGTMNPAGSPYRKVEVQGGGRQIQINARSLSEAKRKLKEICAKYPQVNFDEVWATADSKAVYLDEPLKMSFDFGGELAGRSIVKSALSLAASAGFIAQHTESHRYLLHQRGEAPFGYYYARDLILDRPRQMPLHCVGVSSRNAGGQLLGYVEYFGFRRLVVRLAGRYEGPEIHTVYAIDPSTGQELNLDVDLSLSRAEVDSCFAYECIPEGALEAILHELLPVAFRRSFDRELERVVQRAWHETMRTFGVREGEELPPEKSQEFSRLMTARIMVFLERYVKRRRPEREGRSD